MIPKYDMYSKKIPSISPFRCCIKRKTWVPFFTLTASLVFPWFVLAQGNPKLENYIIINQLIDLLGWLYAFFIKIIFPVVLLISIYTGYRFLSAQGNEEEIRKSRTAFVWLVAGLAIILGGWLIAKVIKSTIDQLG